MSKKIKYDKNGNRKKRWGDRTDGYRVKVDGMHAIMPYVMGERTENETVMTETVDLTAINKYLAKKNYEGIDFKYTIFHVLTAALMKTIALRPMLNYFIAGKRFYERDNISASFTVKKQFTDKSEEGLATLILDTKSEETVMDQVHNGIKDKVTKIRKSKGKNITDSMDTLAKFPRWFIRLAIWFLKKLDFYGKYPKSLMKGDPDFCSVFITNLGSIKIKANYHHLTNWGNNSFFVVIDEKKKSPFYDDKGNVEMRETVNITCIIDERIADGYYFSKSLKIIRKLLANPELLETKALEEIEIDE